MAAIAWEAAAANTELPELLWLNVAANGAGMAKGVDGIVCVVGWMSPYQDLSKVVGKLVVLLWRLIWVALEKKK